MSSKKIKKRVKTGEIADDPIEDLREMGEKQYIPGYYLGLKKSPFMKKITYSRPLSILLLLLIGLVLGWQIVSGVINSIYLNMWNP